ncbi:hypothetical protein [Halogeometricum sp. CBA1124]|uniref:hypothetical protein n=1 Tax=Halogeometricum sp. CBA1124 TaxID=2668071 RepID=UPI0031B67F83
MTDPDDAVDEATRARLRELHDHLAATAERPVERTASAHLARPRPSPATSRTTRPSRRRSSRHASRRSVTSSHTSTRRATTRPTTTSRRRANWSKPSSPEPQNGGADPPSATTTAAFESDRQR